MSRHAEPNLTLPTAENCAHELIDVIPDVMQIIRAEVRQQRGREFSILQLRTLGFLERDPGSALSTVAEHVGLTLSSMSTQISKLVQRGLVARTECAADRRFVTLTLTESGYARLRSVRQGAQASLAARCAALSSDERATLLRALEALRSLVSSTSLSPTKTVMEK